MNPDDKKTHIAELARKHNLEFVALFGSQATGRLHPKSDIDIAVISREPINRLRLMTEFSDIFECADVEVVNLSNVSPTLMREVVQNGKLLYEKEKGAFLKWKLYAIREWMETAKFRALASKKLIEWASLQT